MNSKYPLKTLIVIITVILIGCSNNNIKPYNFTKLEIIAKSLKNVYIEMQDIIDSNDQYTLWENKKPDLLTKLNNIQFEIDALPIYEINGETKQTKYFNERRYNAREIANKLQDIQYLLYDACIAPDYNYFETIAEDEVIARRLDNLRDRAENTGLMIPLAPEYKNLPLPQTDEAADIKIDFSIFKQ